MLHILKHKIITLFVTAIMLLLITMPVFASGGNILKHHYTEIEQDQSVENVVVFGNDVQVSGIVHEAVIVVNGNLTIKNTARIDGLIIVINGDINQESGAKITDNILNISFTKEILNSLIIGLSIYLGSSLFKFVVSILLILLVLITVVLAKERLTSLEVLVQNATKRVLLIGMVSSIILLSLMILLSIIIIGLPIVLILLIMTAITLIIGMATFSRIIGQYIFPAGDKKLWQIALIGALAIIAAINFPIFGMLILIVLTWLSLGMTILWLFEKRKKTDHS